MSELLIAGSCSCFVFWMCWRICSELQIEPGGKLFAWIISGFTVSIVICMFANGLKSWG
jgi:hypothetical protein